MTSDTIIVEHLGAVALVSLNRPDNLNALTPDMLDDLTSFFGGFGDSVHQRVIVLTGAGDKAFCSGTDISFIERLEQREALSAARRVGEASDAIKHCVIPVIAAINGLAAGSGLELALACHIRIASEDASFSLPEVELGTTPVNGGTQRRPSRTLGVGRGNELIPTGKTFDAAEAKRLGIINRVVKQSEVISEAYSVANEIASLAPLAIRACLQAVIRGAEMQLTEGLELEAELFSSLFATEDVREGTRAFLEKRKPVFKGK